MFHAILFQKKVKFVTREVCRVMTSGKPSDAKDFLIREMVVADVDDVVICTSSHLE